MGLHAELSPSSADRWWACPGSVELIKLAPKGRSSEYAEQGTVAHSLAEAMLRATVFKDSTALTSWHVGVVVVSEGYKITVDQEMWDCCEQYVDLIVEELQKYDLTPHYVTVERRVFVPDTQDKVHGTADTIILVPFGRIIVIDFKYGAGHKVDARDNKQLLTYAVGAYFAMTPEERMDISVVEVIIHQPRVGDGGIARFEIPLETMHEFHEATIEAVYRVAPGAEVVAGAHCKWCPAKIICPAHEQMLKDVCQADFADLQLPALVRSDLPSINAMTPERAVRILEVAPAIISMIKEVEQWCFDQESAKPGTIPHHKVVKKDTRRAWIDPDEVCRTVGAELDDHLSATAGHLSSIMHSHEHDKLLAKVLYKPRNIQSPNQIELGLQEVLRCKPAAAKKIVEKLWHNPDKGNTLVHVSDKREPVLPSVETDLASIDVAAIEASIKLITDKKNAKP